LNVGYSRAPDRYNLGHLFVQPLEIGLQHDLAADDAGLIDAALFGHCVDLSVSARRPASVIFTRAISTARLATITRWLCAVASPARTTSVVICTRLASRSLRSSTKAIA
jgi:hypothetical protein